MAQITYPNIGNLQRGNPQISNIQYPYENNLIMNSPYDNYMGRQQQNLSIQYLKCRPVSSKEQARACQIDLDGSLNVFTDVANGKIYTKQINNDGSASFKTYSFVEDNEESYNSSNFVTKDEFNKVIQALVASINNTNDANNNKNNDDKSNSEKLTF